MRLTLTNVLVALSVIALSPPAVAQTTKAKSTLQTEINTSFPDQTTGAITPAITRNALGDFVASWQQAPQVNAQVGTTYTMLDVDYGKLVTFNNTNPVAVTLPGPSTSGFNPWNSYVLNLGTGTVTITPSGATINGSATLVLTTNQGAFIVSDSVNYKIAAVGPLSSSVTNAMLATMTGPALKGITGAGPSNPSDLTPGQVGGILCTPNRQIFTSGTSQTYTTPTCNGVLATWLEADLQGGGGGGAGSGTGAGTAATAGNASVFGALTANGGGAGTFGGAGGAGGTCSGVLGTQQNFPGMAGGTGETAAGVSESFGGLGGISFYGAAGAQAQNAAGGTAPTNSGGGGSGGGTSNTAGSAVGGGGGSGCHIKTLLLGPAGTITYTVGASANGGGAGASGFAGGAGAAGLLDVVAHWQ